MVTYLSGSGQDAESAQDLLLYVDQELFVPLRLHQAIIEELECQNLAGWVVLLALYHFFNRVYHGPHILAAKTLSQNFYLGFWRTNMMIWWLKSWKVMKSSQACSTKKQIVDCWELAIGKFIQILISRSSHLWCWGLVVVLWGALYTDEEHWAPHFSFRAHLEHSNKAVLMSYEFMNLKA